MPAAVSLTLMLSARTGLGWWCRPARSSCWLPMRRIGRLARLQWSHTRGYSQASAAGRMMPGPVSATRCGRSAPPARPGCRPGRAKLASSPTRSTMEYADSTPRARISREPTSTCPASAMQGCSASAATWRDAVGHLAGAGGEVEGALAGDHQVGRGGPAPAARRRRRPGRCPGLPGGAEQQQREAEAAGGAGALGRARPSCRWRRPAARAARRRPGAGRRRPPSAARRRWWRRSARAAGCPRRWRRPARRPATRSRAAARSTLSRSARPLGPASGRRRARRSRRGPASSPAPPSLVPEPPSPTTTRSAPGVDRGRDQLADAVGRRAAPASRGLRRGQVQAARLGALDVRRAAVDQHRAGHRLAVRPATRSRPAGRRPARRAARRRSRGRRRPSAPGRARRRGRGAASPRRSPAAASTALSVPANLSGAISTRMAPILPGRDRR